VRIAPLELFRPVLVVLLVQKADARALHSQSIEHDAGAGSFEYRAEHPRHPPLCYDLELVFAVRHLDDGIAHLLLLGAGIDIGMELAVDVDAKPTGVLTTHVDDGKLGDFAPEAAFLGRAEASPSSWRGLERNATQPIETVAI